MISSTKRNQGVVTSSRCLTTRDQSVSPIGTRRRIHPITPLIHQRELLTLEKQELSQPRQKDHMY